MLSSFKIVIVGAGRMAREHIRAFADVPGVNIVGIASRTVSRAEQLATEFNIPVVSRSITELYERTHAQLAVVTVSAESMCAIACQSFSFSWDILLEKPVGINLTEAAIIEAAARESSCRVFVALNRRFLSSTRAALDDLERRSGPRHIQLLDQLDPRLTASYGHPAEVVNNLMFFSSIHVIDYFSVFGRGGAKLVHPIFAWNATKPWVISAAVEFESGDTGLYQAVWDAPGPWGVSINTPDVRWEMRPLERATYQLLGERRTVEVEVSEADKKFKPGFRLQAEQVIDAVQGRPSAMPTLHEALRSMRLIGSVFGLGQSVPALPVEAMR